MSEAIMEINSKPQRLLGYSRDLYQKCLVLFIIQPCFKFVSSNFDNTAKLISNM